HFLRNRGLSGNSAAALTPEQSARAGPTAPALAPSGCDPGQAPETSRSLSPRERLLDSVAQNPAGIARMSAEQGLIAVVGGTGPLGAALARRWAKAGLEVVIGSRDPARAREAAAALRQVLGRPVESASNRDAASRAAIVVVTVPYAAQADTLTDIRPVV